MASFTKRYIIVLACTVSHLFPMGGGCIGCLYAQSQSGSKASSQADHDPDIVFDHQTYDFGTIAEKQSHTFTFTNKGNACLVLKYVATGCGCTTAEYTQEPVEPGKTGTVVVSFDPTAQRAGAFRKSITVYTNAPSKYTRIFIKGEIIKEKEKKN